MQTAFAVRSFCAGTLTTGDIGHYVIVVFGGPLASCDGDGNEDMAKQKIK